MRRNPLNRLLRLAWMTMFAASALVWAQQQTATPPDPERPEYRAKSLPSDTFKPSEKVQEDFPVPFPEDI